MVLHVLICFWIFIGQADFMEKPSWISLVPQNQSALSYYIDASYFVVTTASTVGYGDIIPVNKLEMVYCMALEVLI
jgi:Ion channel